MARVLFTRRKVSGLYRSNDAFYQSPPVQATRALWTISVRVEPAAGPAFDARIDAWLYDTDRPWADTLIPVLYDPADHRKVVFDHSVEARNAAQQATFAMREQWLKEESRSPVDRLTELMQLRERGEITEVQYEERRRKLLGN
jgi:hypothetical protein